MILDLDDESRKALEWDAVLALVASHAVSAIGAERVRRLVPMADAARVAEEHARVAELARHLLELGRPVPGRVPDPGPAFDLLPVEGARLSAPLALDVATLLLAAADLRGRLTALEPESFPLLRALGRSIPDLTAIARPIARGVLPDGRIADDASPELARLRAAIARTGDKLRRMLESWTRDPSFDSVVRDEFVTQRNGRYVVPVRADARRAVRGIVHAASSSGATLFVEPLESVEWNNELVRLAEAELEEQDRILAAWTNGLREHLTEVRAAVKGIADADSLQARALFAAALDAVRPRVEPGLALRLEEVRHPLLDQRLRDAGGRAVPLTVAVAVDEHVLLLSGPNTGGKTVALKTIGLAALMAQAGIPVCAAVAELPSFSQLRADIGDHQFIEADLLTFSAHVQAVGRFLREARPPALFLFDEIGSGTDPAEGSALARAVLEDLLRPGLITVATTHQSPLKVWAFTTPGAVSAALEFDSEALRPTYRVLMGAAGASAGLDIAARLGLDPGLVRRAREHMAGGTVEAEAYMSRLREARAEVEELRDRLAGQEATLVAEQERVQARAAVESARRSKEAAAALEAALREFREEGKREIAGIENAKERERAARERDRAARRLAAEAGRRKDELGRADGLATEAALPLETGPTPGAKVHVYSLGKSGEVVSVRGTRAEVRFGSVVFTVPVSDLRRVPAEDAMQSRASKQSGASTQSGRFRSVPALPGGASARASVDDLTDAGGEILLIGKRVDEALEELDRWLDQVARGGRNEVRVVHGHGTGKLRAAIRRFLAGHPHVESHRPGTEHEGGDGATVVALK